MFGKLKTALKVQRTFGFLGLITLVSSKMSKRISNLDENREWKISSASWISSNDLGSLLNTILPDSKKLEEELASIQIDEKDRKGFFDLNYDLGANAGRTLYSLVRTIRPKYVIETGVAAGKSSTLILTALKNNGLGKLNSFDITEKVGELIPENLKQFWQLSVLGRNRKEDFKKHLLKLNGCDLFIHDSDHSEEWQIFEFFTVTSHFQSLKYIMIDDPSKGVIDAAEKMGWKSHLIDDNRKFSAFLLK